jgi:AAA domain
MNDIVDVKEIFEKVRAENAKKSWREQIMTAKDLQHRNFAPVSYVIPDLVPEGLSLLVGRPKLGKSWMALDMCLAVSGARFCLGERKPAEGDVLCCALEDNSRRLRRRIDRLLPPKSHAWPERLMLATEWRRLDKGGVDDLQEWAESVPKPKLIVLDTLAGVRPIRQQNGYMEDYESVVTLHRLANKTGIAILVLHHTRKMEADDPIRAHLAFPVALTRSSCSTASLRGQRSTCEAATSRRPSTRSRSTRSAVAGRSLVTQQRSTARRSAGKSCRCSSRPPGFSIRRKYPSPPE